MTISTEIARIVVGPPTVDVLIPFNYPVHAMTEIKVVCADGTVAIENTDYQVILSPPAYGSANVKPLAGLVTKAAGSGLVISRELPLTQPVPVASANQIIEPELQKALDRAAMRDQQLLAEILQTIRRPVTEAGSAPFILPDVATRALKVLGFDAAGVPIAIQDVATLVELEAALAIALGHANAAAASAGAAATSATLATNQVALATTQAGNAAASAAAADLSEANAESYAQDAEDQYTAILAYVGSLAGFNRKKLGPLTAGQTVVNVTGSFLVSKSFLFFDGALLDPTDEYTPDATPIAASFTLATPAVGGEELELFEFPSLTITDALNKTLNLSDIANIKTARNNLELTKAENYGDANAAVTPGTRVGYLTVALTSSRTLTMPDVTGGAYNQGETIDFIDLVGGVTGVNTWTFQRSGSNTINGGTTAVLSTTRGGIRFYADVTGGRWLHMVQAVPTAVNGKLVGSSEIWNGPRLPSLYQWEDGAAVSRATYSDLLNAITLVSTGTTAASNNTITAVAEDLRNLGLVGAKIEGTGIPANTTISSITATTIVMSQNASASVSGTTFRVFPHGNGDGSTTFNKPDARGRGNLGRDDMGGTAAGRVTNTGTGNPGLDATRLGNAGGVDRHAITLAQLAAHGHTITDPGHTHNNTGGGNAVGTGTFPAGQNANAFVLAGLVAAVTGITINNSGSGEAHPNVQPSIVRNSIIFAGV